MNNENEQSYRRLPDSTPSPNLRRSKSVRASFRMLGSRWKSASNAGTSKIDSTAGPTQKHCVTAKDAVSERFGKDFNRNVKQPMTDPGDRLQSMVPPSMTTAATMPSSASSLPQTILAVKTKTKFFHAFAKENVNERHIHYEIPKNVAPKAAALLQIPVLLHRQQPIESNNQCSHQHQQRYRQELKKKHDLIKMDGKFNVNLDRNSCDLIANSNQFALLKSLSENIENGCKQSTSQDMFKAATIRRTPYWPNNQPLKYSKNSSCFRTSFSLHSVVCFFRFVCCAHTGLLCVVGLRVRASKSCENHESQHFDSSYRHLAGSSTLNHSLFDFFFAAFSHRIAAVEIFDFVLI